MANNNRFTSVNLNKSYGHSGQSSNSSTSTNYGLGRGRGGGGNGNGMVLLSRPRSAHKVGPKLSVPPPLNLPSLRKEHQRFDSLGNGPAAGGTGGVSGGGVRPPSSGVGWSKPSVVEGPGGGGGGDRPLSSEGVDHVRGGGVSVGSGVYVPPSAASRMASIDGSVSVPSGGVVQKASVFRGEDFPSLRATLSAVNPNSNGPTQNSKQNKDLGHQKHGHAPEGSGGPGLKEGLDFGGNVDIGFKGRDDDHHHKSSIFRPVEQGKKQDDYFPGPLPLVRLSPRSDWADDERDTSHGLSDKSRDYSYSRPQAYWDRNSDLPRSSLPPVKPAHNLVDRRGQRDDDVGKSLPNEVSNVDPFGRDVRIPSREGREGHSWRTPGNARDEYNVGATVSRDYMSGQRDHGRQQWNKSTDINNGRGLERNIRGLHGNDSNKFGADVAQNSTGLRPSFSVGNKELSGSNFGRDKRSSLRNEKPYVEDPFSGFDAPDPFPGSILGVVKRKKDTNKPLDFHDPVRESFEAELERVQKLQEQERQRVIEEQERAVEMARREEEETLRVAREQEERQRQLEEEAREAAWRAEQERVETLRRAEEQRIAREEEKQRIVMEEERRKQAAKQKLIELEEKMARRQTESSKANSSGAVPSEILPPAPAPRADDFSCWEDGEKMVERITNSASSDSSLSRPFDMGSRVVPGRDGSFVFPERSKPFNSRRRDMFENGNSSSFFSADYENGHHSPRRDVSMGGRPFPRKDLYSGQGYMPTRGYYRGGMPEPPMDDFPYARGHRWNISGDGDPYGRNMELEADFADNMGDRFDLGWGQGRGRGNTPFPERFYQNPDSDELYNYGRSRYPVRQPRVLPPPLPSLSRNSFRGESAKDGEQSAISGEQELDRSTTPGHDSQSSLSVSSPPSSPTHLSHDDLDESRETLGVSARTEGQDISLSENDEALVVNDTVVKGTASSVSVADDEEWAIENNEEQQEQEEYDEDVGYHEEDEVHEGDDEDAELNREFENLQLEGNDSPRTDNLVLGFDQGVEVGMPNEDYERSPRVDDSNFVGLQGAVSVVEQQEPFDSGLDGLSSQIADVSQLSTDESRVMVQDPEKVSESPNIPLPLDPLNTGGSGSGTVKLQFGLFSGPSLIPSPVPAIQIGSIQMPLQLHPQINPSLTHMHNPQPPLFQFGQLRYPSPISQGILPLAPQSMSFVQPNVQPVYCSSQVLGCPPSVQPVQDSSQSSVKDDALSHSMKSSHVLLPHQLNVHQNTESREAGLLATPGAGSSLLSQNHGNATGVDQIRRDLGQQTDSLSHSSRNSKPLLNNRASESRVGPSASHLNVKGSGGPLQGQFVGNRGRRFAFTARNPGARASSSANEASRLDSNGFQRKPRRGPQRFEFRVRQPADGKPSSVMPSSGISVSDTKSNFDEISGSHPKTLGKEVVATSGLDTSNRAEGSLKRNMSYEDDVDAPLQSGIVRIFKQPGIEAPSDDDDFIEVRSKRQMLNDRREQREKEIKAKTSNLRKGQRKVRPSAQSSAIPGSLRRIAAPSSAQVTESTRSAVAKRGSLNNELSATLNNGVQPLAPIGTPPAGAECQTDGKAQTIKPPQTITYASGGGPVGHEAPDPTFDAQRKVVDGVQSLGSWSNPSINQPVMALTQTQLEEAMKPAHFDPQVISVGDCGTSVNDPGIPSSVIAKDSPFSSVVSPINSLLAGEKIQFGAVTSPTILPPSSRVSSLNIRPPASLPLDIQISQSMPASQNNCDILFGKEKHPDASCPPLEDRQAEADAEAAASAVAVAAIGNDEVVGSGIGSCSTATSDSKGFNGAALNGIKTGMSGDQHVIVSQTKAEETLSVALPADLSVETPPMSIWPPLPSPHSSSTQMLSPFPGGPTSHFPFYDMNPMMGGPVFAFGPHEESAGPQPQQRKSSVSSSGLVGTWQQCHNGVDSFYGPPAGFTAPYINPPGSIPGVQGSPHMVVYNHFAPVGQFGQVGLSYMGTTYIPSGKQPDWKHCPASSLGGGDGDMNSTNLVPVQRSAPNVPAPVQHLAPGSPLLSMPAMFEVSPFQSSHDNSVHSRWSHVQPSSIHAIPQSVPLQQQAEGVVQSQSSHGSVDNHSLAANGFSKPQILSPLEEGRSFSMVTNAPVTPFPDELGLVNPPVSSGPEALSLNVSLPGQSTKVAAAAEGSGSNRASHTAVPILNKPQSTKQRNPSGQQHYNHYQRGGGQKNGSGREWSNRRSGYHGRNHSPGGERGFPPAKVKQIYVAKQK